MFLFIKLFLSFYFSTSVSYSWRCKCLGIFFASLNYFLFSLPINTKCFSVSLDFALNLTLLFSAFSNPIPYTISSFSWPNSNNFTWQNFGLYCSRSAILYASVFQPFLYGGTLFSYLNFRGTPIILVNNIKVFNENFSMISQFLFQNHGDL